MCRHIGKTKSSCAIFSTFREIIASINDSFSFISRPIVRVRLISLLCLIFQNLYLRSQKLTKISLSEPLPYSYGHSRLILDHPDTRDSRPTSRVTQAKSTNSVAGRTSKDSERAKSQQKGTDRASWNITPPEEDNFSDANNHLHLPPEVRNHIYKHLRFGLSVLLASKQTYRKASLFSTPRTH